MIHSTPPGINARYVMTDGHNYALRRCVGAAAHRARSTELRNMRVFHSHSHCAAIKRCLRCKNGTSRHKKKKKSTKRYFLMETASLLFLTMLCASALRFDKKIVSSVLQYFLLEYAVRHPQPAAATYIFQFLLQAFFRAEKWNSSICENLL